MYKLNTLFALLMVFATFSQAQVFVSDFAVAGNQDGTSWTNAFLTLEEAIADAGEGDELWVALGEYKPPSVIVSNGAGLDTTNTYFINKDLKIYGGFFGGETMIEQRNPTLNPTLLSGDIAGNDIRNRLDTLKEDNGHHLLYLAENITNNTVIDGFFIIRGYASTTATAFDESAYKGGGIFSVGGTPMIKNCFFSECHALVGGALFIQGMREGAEIVLDECDIDLNAATLDGSGVFLTNLASVKISNTKISRNTAVRRSALVTLAVGTLTIENCEIRNNTAGEASALFSRDNINQVFVNLDIRDNVANGSYTLYMDNIEGDTSNTIFTQCLIENNSADTIGAGVMQVGGSIQATNCLIANNVVEKGVAGSAWVGDANLELNHVTFANQNAPALALSANGALTTTNSIFHANQSGFYNGGGAVVSSDGNVASDMSFDAVFLGGDDLTNTDPLFNDLAAENYIPTLASPCLDAAVSSTESVDARNAPRDANPDIGALENSFVATNQQEISGANIHLYPTMTNDLVHLLAEDGKGQSLRYQIYSTSGQLITSQDMKSNQETLHVGDWAPGMYQVTFYRGTEKATRTFMVIQ